MFFYLFFVQILMELMMSNNCLNKFHTNKSENGVVNRLPGGCLFPLKDWQIKFFQENNLATVLLHVKQFEKTSLNKTQLRIQKIQEMAKSMKSNLDRIELIRQDKNK